MNEILDCFRTMSCISLTRIIVKLVMIFRTVLCDIWITDPSQLYIFFSKILLKCLEVGKE